MKRFILDHNLSPNLARALGLLVHGDEVTCLKDLNWHTDPDEVWIPRLSDQQAVVITCDLDIVRNPHRQLIFRKAKLTAFSFSKPGRRTTSFEGRRSLPAC